MAKRSAPSTPAFDHIDLGDIQLASSQVWRGIRIVPLLKSRLSRDISLAATCREHTTGVVALDGADPNRPNTVYAAYVPHALVLQWRDDGSSVTAYGARLERPGSTALNEGVRLYHRVAKRGQNDSLRLLPLHLAMEGFLAQYFGGPDIAWQEYSQHALRQGLTPRIEPAVRGRWLAGLQDALRVFEIHDTQVGCLLFVADALASVFIVPRASDYRRLHRTLLEDFYGELLWHYGVLYDGVTGEGPRIAASSVRSLADLVAGVEQMRAEWRSHYRAASQGLLSAGVTPEYLNRLGPFRLLRFQTSLDPGVDNHIGEAIIRDDGAIEYLKTYRLSASQTRRSYLLSGLSHANWNLDVAAAELGHSRTELITRLERAGFGYLLRQQVLDEARRARRKRRRR